MSNVKKFLTPEGAQALRDFAAAMPVAIESIYQSTETLLNAFFSCEDSLGSHSDSFFEMLESVKKAGEIALDAINVLPARLEKTASDIDEYLARTKSLRGGASADVIDGKQMSSSGNTVSASSSRIANVKDLNDLTNYLYLKYCATMTDDLLELDFNAVKKTLGGVEMVFDDFPEAAGLLELLSSDDSDNIMSALGDTLFYSSRFFNDISVLERECDENSSCGFWIRNSNVGSIGVHEATHIVEWALVKLNVSYSDCDQRLKAWNTCAEASKIVTDACRNIQETPYGSKKTHTELIQAISTYALCNDSETMAEAFADVYTNGDRANPLSIEIKRLCKEQIIEYKRYKGETC